jgi:hypothetical protein
LFQLRRKNVPTRNYSIERKTKLEENIAATQGFASAYAFYVS